MRLVLKLGAADSDGGFVVVTQVGNLVFGAIVDSVFHTEEIVIKPMSSKLRHIGVFSGTTGSRRRTAPPAVAGWSFAPRRRRKLMRRS